VYGKLLQASIAETGQVATKIIFGPNAKQPLESKSKLHMIHVKQIAKLIASKPGCKATIVGHCSKSASEQYNNKLSLQRAGSIQKMMVSFAPEITGKTEILGRGFSENLVGTGTDDITDQIDRRVEFKFTACGP
jgi:outer membrane protein OmpA-like peptidoglycan-associated protein